jgi:hypothetical protein
LQGDKTIQKKLNFTESFLVTSLKKQIRGLKIDLQHKDSEIGQLKRNVKLAKQRENDSDAQAYMEEC